MGSTGAELQVDRCAGRPRQGFWSNTTKKWGSMVLVGVCMVSRALGTAFLSVFMRHAFWKPIYVIQIESLKEPP